ALERGEAEEAERLLRGALRLAPASAAGQANLGAALLRLGRNREALAHLETAVALDPGCAAAWCNLGLAELRLGRRRQAEAHLRRAAALDPGDVAPLVNLARLQAAAGEPEAALLTLRAALARPRVPPQAHLHLALLLERQGRRAEAADHLAAYLAAIPPEGPLAARLGRHLAELRRAAPAVKVAEGE
ncbi:MAG: tetratricopeptide repeat protein, partial [Nitrospirae bacterium]